MIVRKINANEYKETSKVYHIAFGFKMDDSSSNEELIRQFEENPQSRFSLYYLEKWAAFNDDNKMIGFVSALPYNVYFDGHIVLMSGIGGVSTLPEYRRHGVMKEIMTTLLKDEYHNNYVFSYLYPFSNTFYNQFGYNPCCEQVRWTISMKAIKPFDVNYQAYMHEKGSHTEDIKRVYKEFMKDYNLSVIREDIDYLFYQKSNPAVDQHYTYVFKNASNEAIAVVTLRKVQKNNKNVLLCNHFYFTCFEGLKAIFNHILTYRNYYDCFEFVLPIDIQIANMIQEWALYPSTRNIEFKGMARVINAKKALELAKYDGSGTIVIKINDDIIFENNKTFTITFKNNKCESIFEANDHPDIEMGIDDFSSLIVGNYDYQDYSHFDNIKIYNNHENIKKVFYFKKNFIYDAF